MESELEEQSRDNRALQLAMDRQDLRLQASTTDMMKERQKVNSAHTHTHTHTQKKKHTHTHTHTETSSLWCSVRKLLRVP